MKLSQQVMIGMVLVCSAPLAWSAPPSTLDAKKRGEQEMRQLVEPILNQYCKDQCKLIHIDTEVDVAVDDEVTPGFEEHTGKAVLAAASGKVKILMDKNLGQIKQTEIVGLLNEHLKELNYPVTVETQVTKFPQPATSSYRLADLREKVTHDIKASLQGLLGQFCSEKCALGEFDVQTEVVNAEDVDYSSAQDYFQDGPAAIRVRGVKATLMIDQELPAEEANGIVEMAKLKVAQFKASQITSQTMKFPKAIDKADGGYAGNGAYGRGSDSHNSKSDSSNNETHNKNDNSTDSKHEKFERFEKIERVENGDAVQQTLEKFRVYGIFFAAIVLALLMALVAVSFRKQIFKTSRQVETTKGPGGDSFSGKAGGASGTLSGEEKSALIARRLEADRMYAELVGIFSEQPKVAKHVFGRVLTEEGVETTAQYLQIFGESVVMDLLRDPALQADLSELMDFYAVNTFEISEEEKMQLLKKLHHRTVSGKMAVHGSRSAVLFDFLVEMDAPQIVEMIKNESNTVKAIVLTQCDQKKRQALFVAHDDATRLKLMTELSRIDHLPKNYIYNVATALRRKKAENPKLNTEALPGTDVLVTFLEKANIETQRTIIHQLMNNSGADALQNLKSKLASLETLRFMKDAQLIEVITNVKNDELVQFLKGCSVQVKDAVLTKAPQDLAGELNDQLVLAEPTSREAYSVVERKVINRIKVLANQGEINLAEINERMFAEEFGFNNNMLSEVSESDMRKVG